MNFEHDTLALAQLHSNEQLLWTGQPNAKRLAMPKLALRDVGIVTFFALVLTFFCGMGLLVTIWLWELFGVYTLVVWVYPFWLLPFYVVKLALIVPWLRYRAGRRTVYVVTNRRAMIVTVGRAMSVRSYSAKDMCTIRCIERAGGAGDLSFAYLHGTWRGSEGFVGIPNVRRVEQLMLKVFKTKQA